MILHTTKKKEVNNDEHFPKQKEYWFESNKLSIYIFHNQVWLKLRYMMS